MFLVRNSILLVFTFFVMLKPVLTTLTINNNDSYELVVIFEMENTDYEKVINIFDDEIFCNHIEMFYGFYTKSISQKNFYSRLSSHSLDVFLPPPETL